MTIKLIWKKACKQSIVKNGFSIIINETVFNRNYEIVLFEILYFSWWASLDAWERFTICFDNDTALFIALIIYSLFLQKDLSLKSWLNIFNQSLKYLVSWQIKMISWRSLKDSLMIVLFLKVKRGHLRQM